MGSYRITTWNDDLTSIPRNKELWLQDPLLLEDTDNDLHIRVDVLVPNEITIFWFNSVVDLLCMEETTVHTDHYSDGGHTNDMDDPGSDGDMVNDWRYGQCLDVCGGCSYPISVVCWTLA
jgi:hypothetical protein